MCVLTCLPCSYRLPQKTHLDKAKDLNVASLYSLLFFKRGKYPAFILCPKVFVIVLLHWPVVCFGVLCVMTLDTSCSTSVQCLLCVKPGNL